MPTTSKIDHGRGSTFIPGFEWFDKLGWRARACVLAAAMYAPYGWLLVMNYPWNEYRWMWIKMWLALPCLVPSMLLRRLISIELDDLVSVLVMSLVAVGSVVMLTQFTKNRGKWMVIATTGVLVYSTVTSFMLYHAFRA